VDPRLLGGGGDVDILAKKRGGSLLSEKFGGRCSND